MAEQDEDERLALLLRAIRRRSGMTQAQVAAAAGVPRDDVVAVEAGRAGDVRLGRLRLIFATVDGRLKAAAWWRGAAADRLLDERHAGLVEKGVALYRRRGWQSAVEVTFAEWGERGSIDLLGAHPPTRAAVVNEVKASVGSFEEMNRTLDIKVRLAPKLVKERIGWRPTSVSRVLIVPNDSTIRRLIARHGQTMDVIYPVRGREVRAWLRRPDRPVAGIWFVSEVGDGNSATRQKPSIASPDGVRDHWPKASLRCDDGVAMRDV